MSQEKGKKAKSAQGPLVKHNGTGVKGHAESGLNSKQQHLKLPARSVGAWANSAAGVLLMILAPVTLSTDFATRAQLK